MSEIAKSGTITLLVTNPVARLFPDNLTVYCGRENGGLKQHNGIS